MSTETIQAVEAFRSGRDVLFVVDVSSFIFRAYYSVGYLTTADGTPTGAVFGVANMLTALFSDYRPSHVIVAMDSKTPSFRKEIYPEYKANRPPPPEDLKKQFPIVAELVDAFELKILQKDGFEADDVIATVVDRAVEQGMRCVIVSADKDLMQLVGDDVQMLDTMKDKLWAADAVEEKWGVPPRLLGDLLAIAGDSSDNIPGVPRVGPKTAAPLLNQFGSLEQLLERTEEIKAKGARSRMEEFAESARLSRRLVELDRGVPLTYELQEAEYKLPSADRLGPLLGRLELRQLSDRLLGKQVTTQKPSDLDYSTVDTVEKLREITGRIRKAGRFAIDLETTSIDAVSAKIVGVALSVRAEQGYYIPVAHAAPEANIDIDIVLAEVGPLLTDPKIEVVIQNVKYEDTIFRRMGIEIAGAIFDPMLASYLLRGDGRRHNLDVLAGEILGRSTTSYDEVTEKSRGHQLSFGDVQVERATGYAAEDAEVALALADALAPQIQERGFVDLLHEVELPTARVLCGMELNGVSIDADHLGRMSGVLGERIEVLQEQAHELAGHPFNLGSPKQLQAVLFEELALPTQKKTKTGFSTDSEVLETLAPLHGLPRLLLEYRLCSKLKSTYVDALPKLVNPSTQRIHTSYNQAVTATGRLSSTNPNLQNIPIRSELGRQIRQAFVAPPGHVILSADYSQVELRVLAHLSKDATLLEAFRNGDDIHAQTARAIFGLSPDHEVSREQRSQAKVVNFGVIYGKTEFSLAKELNIPRSEARRFIEEYFQLYSGVSDYMESVIRAAHKDKRVTTMLGRVRELRDLDATNTNVRNQAERMARNTPIQGTAADLLKLAMIKTDARLRKEAPDAKMLLTVHDELVFEVKESDAERVRDLVVSAMESAIELDVPLVVDAGIGANWAEAH